METPTMKQLKNVNPDNTIESYTSVIKVYNASNVVLKEMSVDTPPIRELIRVEIDFLNAASNYFKDENQFRAVKIFDYDYENCRFLMEKLDTSRNLQDFYIQSDQSTSERNINILIAGISWLAALHNNRRDGTNPYELINKRVVKEAIRLIPSFESSLKPTQLEELLDLTTSKGLRRVNQGTVLSGDPSPESFVESDGVIIGYDFNASEIGPKELDLGKYLHNICFGCIRVPDDVRTASDFFDRLMNPLLDAYEKKNGQQINYQLLGDFYAFSMIQRYGAGNEDIRPKLDSVKKLFQVNDRQSFVDAIKPR